MISHIIVAMMGLLACLAQICFAGNLLLMATLSGELWDEEKY